MDMDISMDMHGKSVDMDMDVKFHIHGKPDFFAVWSYRLWSFDRATQRDWLGSKIEAKFRTFLTL